MRSGLVVGLFACLFLQACATLDKEHCDSQDWQSIGYRFGAQGQVTNNLEYYASACADEGAPPDPDAYMAGYQAGLEFFCTPTNAGYFGESAGRYSGACPDELEPAFAKAYVGGLDLALKKEIQNEQNIKRKLDKLRSPSSGRYWYKKLTGSYQDDKEYLKSSVARSIKEQSEIKRLQTKWRDSDG